MKPQGGAFHDIFVMDTTGQALQQVTKHQSAEHFYFPRWSPGGNRIVFIAHSAEGVQQRFLYMVDRDGINLQKVLDDSTVTSVDWSW
jgi:Tol biopolymer transport system component